MNSSSTPFSSLRSKITYIMLLSVLAIIVAQIIVRFTYLLPQFHALEKEIALKDTHRLIEEIERLDDDLAVLAYDKAINHQVADAINEGNAYWLTENYFVPSTFRNQNINGMQFYNEQGQLVAGLSVDYDFNEITLPLLNNPDNTIETEILISPEFFVASGSKPTTRGGLAIVEDKVVIFSSAAVVDEQQSADQSLVGNVLIWRFADRNVLEQLISVTQLPLQIEWLKIEQRDVSQNNWSPDEVIDFENAYYFRNEQGIVNVYAKDVTGQPIAKLSFSALQGQFDDRFIDNSLAVTLVLSIVLLLAANSYLHHSVVGPIDRLMQVLTHVVRNADYKVRASQEKHDEVGVLANKVNSLLSHVQKQQQGLVEAKVTAESANKAKSSFLANVSHEIRTPIHGILGLTQRAIDTNNAEEKNDTLEKIEFSAKSLLQIVNDLLDFTKIESGKLNIEEIEFEVKKLVENVVAIYKPIAQKKGIDLIVKIDPELPSNLLGDPTRVGQIVKNLLSNAVKFTENGQVHLDVSVKALTPADVTIDFNVKDTGSGIAEDKLQQLFEEFQQQEIDTSGKLGSTELGFAISQQLARLLGGEISVESAIGKGSSFCYQQAFEVIEHTELVVESKVDTNFSQSKDSSGGRQ